MVLLKQKGGIVRHFALVPVLILFLQATAPAEMLRLQVTYTDGEILEGPLSADLTALPDSVQAFFTLSGSSAGGYGLEDVTDASLAFGDVEWTAPDLESFTATFLKGDAGALVPATLTYAFASKDTSTVDGRLAANFPLTIEGTDVASGETFHYRYSTSTQTVTAVPAPSTGVLLLLGTMMGMLLRRKITGC